MARISIVPYLYAQDQKFCRLKEYINNKTQIYKSTS